MAEGPLPRLAILVSGRGSNMLAIAKACQSGELPAEVVIVLSNCPDADGLRGAQTLDIETDVIDHRQFDSREQFDNALHSRLLSVRPDWIILAGFMRILGREFVERWAGRILNIHPSLLPKYPGLNTHQRAIEAGDTRAGASVHIVTAELDAGPVLGQSEVCILDGDTPESLAARVLQTEHSLFVDVLKQCIAGDAADSRLQ